MTHPAAPALCALLLTAAAPLAPAQNQPDLWNPCLDWVAMDGSDAGTTNGNPGPDSEGNLVWNFEYVTTGGQLGSANPWYDESTTKLVWDSSWFGQAGCWAVGNNLGTHVSQGGATHIYGSSGDNWFPYCPIRRWENTTGSSATVHLRGTLRIGWGGEGGVAGPVDVDLFVGVRPAGSSSSTPLVSGTYSKPDPGSSQVEYVPVHVDLTGLVLMPGDSLVIAHRARNPVGQNRWITLGTHVSMFRPGVEVGIAYCAGDGSGTGCPCGNESGPNGGCENISVRGAELFALGSASLAADDVEFHTVRARGNQTALLFAGTQALSGGNGFAFGDGLLCAGGQIARLGAVQTEACGFASWTGVLTGLGLAAGDTRYFQVWYRDPGGPCGSGYNTSNALAVTFEN